MFKEYLYLLATDKKKGVIDGVLKIFLLILSLMYGFLIRILSSFYLINPHKLDCKVISVGNVTLGGTGKTSLVELIAGYLKDNGHRIAILSRGYKKLDTQFTISDARYETMGDEPYMLSKNLVGVPVIVDKDRVRAGKKAINDYKVDTVLLDDGFQQWRLKKDLDIVTIDATNPLGNLHSIPRGVLREPLSSLKRAGILVLSKVDLIEDSRSIKKFLNEINPDALIIEAIHKPMGFYKLGESRKNLLTLNEFKGKKVSLVCGIADPRSFEQLVRNLGIEIALSFKYPDHHIYTRQDLDKIIDDSRKNGIDMIITTEKDSVRLSNFDTSAAHCFVLRIKLELLQYEEFFSKIHSLY